MKLAVAYCRVSTDLEEQQHSIQEQQSQWLEYFKNSDAKPAQCGLICHRTIQGYRTDGKPIKGELVTEKRLDGLYVDEGISGTSLKNRKAFQQMIEDAKLKKFDIIYVEDVSRFTRSIEDGIKVIKDLRELGVAVYFRKEGFDSLDTSKESELGFRVIFSQEESKAKSDRMKWAFRRIHQDGGWNGSPPYGYTAKKSRLSINEEQAKIVRLIFDLYTKKHYGIGKITNQLNDEKIPTQKGAYWGHSMVANLLRNKIYTGTMIQNREESYDLTRHTRKQVPEQEQVIIHNEELRIIEDDLFKLTEIELLRRKEEFNYGNLPKAEHLFSTLLYCNFCGGAYRRRRRHTKDEKYCWLCSVQERYGRATRGNFRYCPGGRNAIDEEELEKVIKYEILNLQKTNADILFEEYMNKKFADVEEFDINSLQEQNKSLNDEMRQLRKDLQNGLITEDIYGEQVKELATEISNVKADILRVERIEIEKQHHKELFLQYKKAIQNIDVNNLTNSILKDVFYKIYVTHKTVKNKEKVYLRFVYRFLDLTDEMIYNDDVESVNLWIPIDAYKQK